IDAKLVDRSGILLRRTSSYRRESAIDRPRRAEDEAETGGDVAGERAGFHTLRLRRAPQRQRAGREAERTDRYREFLEHSVCLLLAIPAVEVSHLNVASYSLVPRPSAMVSSPHVSRACWLLDSTFYRSVVARHARPITRDITGDKVNSRD